MQTVTRSHIVLDDRGVAWIDDTNTKVIEVVLDKLGWGMTPEEIHAEYPELSLAQIHAAFAYYYDHQEQFDAQIASDRQEVSALAAQAADSPGRRRLRAMGKLP